MRFVVGFLFNNEGTGVVLIEKQKPDWQAGRLNGVGGKIDAVDGVEELPADAMAREFTEETGVETKAVDWRPVAVLTHVTNRWQVNFLALWDSAAYCRVHTVELENVVKVDPFALPSNVMPNLRWLIPLALDPSLARCVFVEDRGAA